MLIFLLACIITEGENPKTDSGNSYDSTADSSGDSTGDSQPDSGETVEVRTFVADVMPVMEGKCAGCHYSEPEGLALYGEAAYDKLVNVPAGQVPAMDRVEPGDLENSYLWRKLEGTHLAAGGEGDQMPSPYAEPLTAAEKETFRLWIIGGAKR
jgi:hypothetical protein